ncbi:MAG: hypothetical protein AB3K77_06280 [Methanosarcinaceae archaeon]
MAKTENGNKRTRAKCRKKQKMATKERVQKSKNTKKQEYKKARIRPKA